MPFTVEVVEQITTVEVVDDTITVSVADQPVVVELSEAGPQGATGPAQPAVFSRAGLLSPIVSTQRFYIERAATITKIRAAVGIPSTGSAVQIDVKVNGVSILSGSPLSVSAGQFTNTRNLSVAVNAGDYITTDVVAVGSTTSGADLTVTVTFD